MARRLGLGLKHREMEPSTGVKDMMPFSVLRSWVLGLFGWSVLFLGVYFLYEWNTRPHTTVTDLRNDNRVALDLNDKKWPLLVGGLVLVSWSFAGFVPLRLLFYKSGSDPSAFRSGTQYWIDRPDGSRLNIEIYGNANGPTMVFTHGWSLNSTEWYYVKQSLATKYRLIVWDLPGLGISRGPVNGDYSLEKMAADLKAVIDEVAPNGRVLLLGHSIGGMITQTFCRLFPNYLRERVSGQVLIHTTYLNPLATATGAAAWLAIQPLLVAMNYVTIALAPLVWISNLQSYANGSLQIASRLSSFAGGQTWGQVDYASWLFAVAWPGVVGRGNLAMMKFDESETLLHIETPTLIIGATHDRLTKLSASRRMETTLPHGLLSEVGGGHLGLWECHEQVDAAIDEFATKYGVPPANSDPRSAFMESDSPSQSLKP